MKRKLEMKAFTQPGRTAVLLLLLLAACGGGGDGTPVVVAPPPVPPPVVDVAVRGQGSGVGVVHVYRDVLRLPVSGGQPAVEVAPPNDVVEMAFTGTHLLLAQDLAWPNQDRVFLYGPNDLAAANPSPGVQLLIPTIPGAGGNSVRDLVVHDGDVYVHTVFDDGNFPTLVTIVTHVFRDLATLGNGAVPDATLTHDQFTFGGIATSTDGLAVADDVLLATGFGNLWVTLDPTTLAGSVVPDRTLDMIADLGVGGFPLLASGEAYLYRPGAIAAFDDPSAIAVGSVPRFVLEGPSTVAPTRGFIARVGDRLFARGLVVIAPIPIVGFDVGGPVADQSPPDVEPGPWTSENLHLAGAADVLVTGSEELGITRVYPQASRLRDGDEPAVYLWHPDLDQVMELEVVAR